MKLVLREKQHRKRMDKHSGKHLNGVQKLH